MGQISAKPEKAVSPEPASEAASAKQIKLLRECIENQDYIQKVHAYVGSAGLHMLQSVMEAETVSACGQFWKHDRVHEGKYKRNGTNPGSIWIGSENIKMRVQRILDKQTGETFIPKCYKTLRKMSRKAREALAKTILLGIAQQDYRKAARMIANSLGMNTSSLGRIMKTVGEQALQEFESKSLPEDTYLVMAMKMTRIYGCQVIVCLGITEDGEVKVPGFARFSTKNADAVQTLLKNLKERGLRCEHGILLLTYEDKGIVEGIRQALGNYAHIQQITSP